MLVLTPIIEACFAALVRSTLKRVFASPILTGFAARRCSDSVVVLAYHDIGTDTGPGHWLRVRREEFDRQLEWLSKFGRFIAPGELPVMAANKERAVRDGGKAGPGADAVSGRFADRPTALRFLLTFDDGYVNNYRLALPILEGRNIPALFFVSTWNTATGEPFWFDRVTVPLQVETHNEIDLRDVGLRQYQFHPHDDRSRWEDIQSLLIDIKALGNPGVPEVDRVLERCDAAAGERGRAALADCRPLQVREILAMRATGLCHFGSHAHRHEILTYLDDTTLSETLRQSRTFMEASGLTPPDDIAYPNGDVDDRVAAASRSAGFRRGYTVAQGLVRKETDALRLPRLVIGGYDTLDMVAFKLNRLLASAAFGLK